MSAFIVDDKTINTIITFLVMKEENSYYRMKLKENGFDLDTPDGADILAREMFRLNAEAVSQRYGEEAEEFRPEHDFKLIDEDINPISVFKSIGCWTYQCSEGDVPLSPLYKLFEEFEKELACDIVMETKEYNDAHWG